MIVDKNKTLQFYESQDCSFSSVIEKMVSLSEVSALVQHDNYHSISDPKRWKIAEKYLDFKKIILVDRYNSFVFLTPNFWGKVLN